MWVIWHKTLNFDHIGVLEVPEIWIGSNPSSNLDLHFFQRICVPNLVNVAQRVLSSFCGRTDGRTDGHGSINFSSRPDHNRIYFDGSPVLRSMRYKRMNKTNIHCECIGDCIKINKVLQ